MNDIWNPWHGCKKYSEGCENCYMYFLDSQRDKDGSEIYKVKTNFNLPLKKSRNGEYKIPSGATIRVCMTSDFFLEEADEWRKEVWEMIRTRLDVTFWLQTKRAERVLNNLPEWWGDGLENVIMVFTTENQKRADERLPILLDLPFKHKGIMCAPMISEITLDTYLKTGDFEIVLVDGENYEGNRPLYLDWVKRLYDECVKYNIKFDFCGTGNVFSVIEYIKIEACNVLYMQRDTGLGQQLFRIIICQSKNDLKIQRRIFPFHQIEKERANLLPGRRGSRLFRFLICIHAAIIISVKTAVHVKSGKSGESCLRHQESIENCSSQEFCHEIPDIGYL